MVNANLIPEPESVEIEAPHHNGTEFVKIGELEETFGNAKHPNGGQIADHPAYDADDDESVIIVTPAVGRKRPQSGTRYYVPESAVSEYVPAEGDGE